MTNSIATQQRRVSMSKVVISTFVSLDGVMEDPGGGEGFKQGGWQLPFFDQDQAHGVRDELFAADALLLGRMTYQHLAAAWPSMTDDDGFADRMNSLPKYVASTTLQEPLAWNATLLKGDVAEAIAELKQQPAGDLLIQGSGELAQTLLRRGLIDEYRLWVHPVVLGSGKRLFKDGGPTTPLRLVDTKTTSTGVVHLTYQPAGDQ
jgi:dihydrofolate reductase